MTCCLIETMNTEPASDVLIQKFQNAKSSSNLIINLIMSSYHRDFIHHLTIHSLVSLPYQFSDEEMEIDSVSVADVLDNQDSDHEIQVLACYCEGVSLPSQLVAGRQ